MPRVLSWQMKRANEACPAKNSVVKEGGYSTHYLALGYHPQLNNELGGSLTVEDGALTE